MVQVQVQVQVQDAEGTGAQPGAGRGSCRRLGSAPSERVHFKAFRACSRRFPTRPQKGEWDWVQQSMSNWEVI